MPNFSEPVCWNCSKANKVIGFFEPCENYNNKIPCEYEPYIKIICVNCKKFDPNMGCYLGINRFDSQCEFMPLDELVENYSKFKTKTIQKTLLRETKEQFKTRVQMCYVCPFAPNELDYLYEKCPVCPLKISLNGCITSTGLRLK